MSKFQDLAGQGFGRLTVLERTENDVSGHLCWLCRCACGNETVVRASHLRSGATQSCGCLKREVINSARNFRHGEARRGIVTSEYRVWCGMIQRCYDPNNSGYKNYGGRGITVNKRWHKYENFLADMRRCPSGKTLDRIDNDGNYGRGLCRWATPRQQANNRRDGYLRGTDHSMAKLSDHDVKQIRRDLRLHRIIAQDYAVSRGTVGRIKSRKLWVHVL
jgi:hypothetical protein